MNRKLFVLLIICSVIILSNLAFSINVTASTGTYNSTHYNIDISADKIYYATLSNIPKDHLDVHKIDISVNDVSEKQEEDNGEASGSSDGGVGGSGIFPGGSDSEGLITICGNGECEEGENGSNCPEDCPSDQTITLEEVQKAIQEEGANWTAGYSRIVSLSDEEKKKLVFSINESEYEKQTKKFIKEHPEYSTTPPISLPTRPISFDWRNNKGDWVTPIKNQDSCGSCWAFGTVGGLESKFKINLNHSSFNPDLSEQDLVSCDPFDFGCNGGFIKTALYHIEREGLVNESCFPYEASDIDCSNKCPHSKSQVHKIKKWSSCLFCPKNTIKHYLIKQGPLIVVMRVYTDFHFYESGIYKHTTGKYKGVHAVVIVGYNDTGRYWIVKNSWGSYWGEDGYVRISYDEGFPVLGDINYIINTDWDNDEILDSKDNCPYDYNPHQGDFDADGIGFNCDSDTFKKCSSSSDCICDDAWGGCLNKKYANTTARLWVEQKCNNNSECVCINSTCTFQREHTPHEITQEITSKGNVTPPKTGEGNVNISHEPIVCKILDLSNQINSLETFLNKLNTLGGKIENIANYYKNKNKEKEVCWNEVSVSFNAIDYKMENIISEMKEDNGKTFCDSGYDDKVKEYREKIKGVRENINGVVDKILDCALV